jgi:hypothetical protein
VARVLVENFPGIQSEGKEPEKENRFRKEPVKPETGKENRFRKEPVKPETGKENHFRKEQAKPGKDDEEHFRKELEALEEYPEVFKPETPKMLPRKA